MHTNLSGNPRVKGITRQTGAQDHLHTIGRLHAVWSWVDEQSIDGALTGHPDDIDEIAKCEGFAAAMVDSGWLVVEGDTLTFPDFSTHNGNTAKRRAKEAKRAANNRKPYAKNTQTVRKGAYENGTDCVPTKQNKTDTKEKKSKTGDKSPITYTPEFNSWWLSYPSRPSQPRGNKKAAAIAFEALDRSQRLVLAQATKHLNAAVANDGAYPLDAERFIRVGRSGGDPPYLGWIDIAPPRTVRKNDQNIIDDGDCPLERAARIEAERTKTK